LLRILGSGGQETARVLGDLELERLCSYLAGGKDLVFKKFQVVCNNRKERDKILLQEVFYHY
jgi:hypothetical protein